METLYLLEEENAFLTQNYIERLKKENSEYEIIRYNDKEISFSKVLEDLDTYNLFSSHKMVVFMNPAFLLGESNKEETVLFEKYLENPNKENTLIIVASKLDDRKKIVKLLRSKAVVPNLTIRPFEFAKNTFKGYEIDDSTIRYLLDFCKENYEKLTNEIEKLKLYCYDARKITKKEIDDVVDRYLDDSIFDLVDSIVNKKKDKAYFIYDELLSHNEEPLKILIMVANQFRLLYQVKVLANEKYTENEIANFLKVHPYRVKLAKEKSFVYSLDELLNHLLSLAQLDEDLKMGKMYPKIGFELFINSL